jgi:hypothetical protein
MNRFKQRSSSQPLRMHGQTFVAYATQSRSGLFCLLLVSLALVTGAQAEPARVAVLDFSVAGVTGEGKSWDSATGKFKPAADKQL